MSAFAVTATTSTDQTPNSSSALTQADFLKLLVTQMTQQDPLNPQSDTAFAAQLAQFSSLQESTTMAGDMASLQADSLIGQTVTVASATNSQKTSSGVVTGVDVSSGSPEIQVNGQLYSLSQITAITPTQTPQSQSNP
jgi:flagellar basal-body rod modification protein FlgD